MTASRHIEDEQQGRILEHTVLFSLRGRTVPVRIQAEDGKSADYYYQKAIQAYRQEHRGEDYVQLIPQDIITITGQIDFEPPRPNTSGYR